MNEDFSQRILDKIERDQIRPLSPKVYRAQKVGRILLLLSCVLCTAFLGVLVVMEFFQVDLEFIRVSSFGPMLRILLAYVPMIWIVFFLFFFLLELYLLRRQTRAYRYPVTVIVGLMVLASALGGLGLYATRLPERVRTSLPRHLPPHVRPLFQPDRPFPHPEDGVLFGRIQSVQDKGFLIQDPPGNMWQVDQSQARPVPQDLIQENHQVIIEGRMSGPRTFQAENIRPYRGPNQGPPPRP